MVKEWISGIYFKCQEWTKENKKPEIKPEVKYKDDEQLLYITISNLCLLKFENVSEQTLNYFNDFKYDKVKWDDYNQVAELCVWFKNRKCEGSVTIIIGTWHEQKISEEFANNLMDAVASECINQGLI